MTEFEIDGVKYQAGNVDLMIAVNIAKRLAPAITRLGAFSALPAFAQAAPTDASEADAAPAAGPGDWSLMLAPIAEAIASLADKDSDFVIFECMAVVRRLQNDRWVPVWNKAAKRPMFDDINFISLLAIVKQVLEAQLVPFSGAAPSTSSAAA